MCRSLLPVAALLLLVGPLAADEPPVLPQPRPIDSAPVVVAPAGPPAFYRPSYMERWQFYSVDRTGTFRPRVVFAPQPYYLFNGQPYPYLIRQWEMMPYLSN
jgi:hypothetical protein